jgi:hypothetical protein
MGGFPQDVEMALELNVSENAPILIVGAYQNATASKARQQGFA